MRPHADGAPTQRQLESRSIITTNWYHASSQVLIERIGTEVRFEVSTTVKIQVEVLWVMTPFKGVEDTNVSEGHAASIFLMMVFRNFGILPHHYTA
jgi:hypothetical protein